MVHDARGVVPLYIRGVTLLAVILLASCASREVRQFRGSARIHVQRPVTREEARLREIERRVQALRGRHRGHAERLETLARCLRGPKAALARKLDVVEALFAYVEASPEVLRVISANTGPAALYTLQKLSANPAFEAGMLVPYERIVRSHFAGDMPGEPGTEERLFLLLDEMVGREDLSSSALVALADLVDALARLSAGREGELLGILSDIVADKRFDPRTLGMAARLVAMPPEDAAAERLRLLLEGIRGERLTEKMLDFYGRCGGAEAPLSQRDAALLSMAMLSNPRLLEGQIAPFLSSVEGFTSRAGGKTSKEGYGAIYRALASSAGFAPWMADVYAEVYGKAAATLGRAAGEDFALALAQYLQNPGLDISMPRRIGALLLSLYRRGDTRPGSINALEELDDIFQSPHLDDAAFSLLQALAARVRGEALINLLWAFGALLETRAYTPSMLPDFAFVVSALLKDGPKERRKQKLLSLWRLLKIGRGDPQLLAKARFLLALPGGTPHSLLVMLKYFVKRGVLMDLMAFKRGYTEAAAFASALGASDKSEVSANFAYAIATIGKEATSILFETFGIEYFARYPRALLLELEKGLEPEYKKTHPIFVMAAAKADWNGAFYEEVDLGGALDNYRFMAVEAAGDIELIELLSSRLARQRSISGATGRVAVLVLSGHGGPRALQLGPRRRGARARITAADMPKLGVLSGYMADGALIVLNACLTGKRRRNLAAAVSTAFEEQRVFAPVASHAVVSYRLDPDGLIAAPDFRGALKVYLNGTARGDGR
jgi:hypothetical protein